MPDGSQAQSEDLMTAAAPQPDNSLEAIRTILLQTAQQQEENAAAIARIDERLDRIAASQEQFQTDLAETKALVQANAEKAATAEDQTSNVEVDTLTTLQELKTGQDALRVGQEGLRGDVRTLSDRLTHSMNTLSQAMSGLVVEVRSGFADVRTGFADMPELFQEVIDSTKSNTEHIIQSEEEE